jgi:AMMECR1 domain-containing protein
MTFLDQTCVKAGLRPGCWRDPDTQILVFEAQIFGEKEEK